MPSFEAYQKRQQRREEVMDYQEKLQHLIATKGWAVHAIYPTSEFLDAPYLAYTIGLLDRHCACELLITGLPPEVSQQLLNDVAAEMVDNTQLYPAVWPLVDGYELVAVTVPRPQPPLVPNLAYQYYQRDTIPIVQYVWPAYNHTYPWDKAWPFTAEAQPVGGRGRPPSKS